jgi:ornithine--oxo-acid transaminase
MPTSQDFINLENQYGAHNYEPLPVVIAKAEGVWVWDVEGKKYIDMLSSYSALNQGHQHPYIMSKVRDQLETLLLTSRAFFNNKLGPFLKHLCDLSGFEMALPMNSGTEAVETALKLARKYGYKKRSIPDDKAEIIVCEHNFHGRTITISGFSSDKGTYDGFGPFPAGFITIPYNDPEAFEAAITSNTIAILVEPIQGEAGVNVPSDGYLKKVREICDRHNLLLILDEIQTGLARTGKMFAYEHEDIKPDILILGKALGGGVLPVSAVLSSGDIMEVFTPGDHGSTFGGNPLACVVADAALDVIIDENLADNAREMGKYFIEQLSTIKNDKINVIRGKGLLIGVEMALEENETVRPLCEELIKEGVLAKDTHEKTIRFAPPLIITKDDIDWAMERIRKVLEH